MLTLRFIPISYFMKIFVDLGENRIQNRIQWRKITYFEIYIPYSYHLMDRFWSGPGTISYFSDYVSNRNFDPPVKRSMLGQNGLQIWFQRARITYLQWFPIYFNFILVIGPVLDRSLNDYVFSGNFRRLRPK